MQRNETENFRDYQARRHLANMALKDINKKVRLSGKGPSSRALQRDAKRGTGHAFSTGIKGMASSRNTQYGANLKSHFDGMRGRVPGRRSSRLY